MINEQILKSDEKAVFALRSLYRRYGYLPFKMSKFEEFEFYIRNKDFLVSDRIITFNDTNGKLMALKPDVTLSIIKNGEDIKGTKQKVFYNENVYRISESTRQFKEIMQAGLECIGDIDIYDIYEAVSLAAQSLALISDDFVLEISHLGILSAVLDSVCSDKTFQRDAARYIAEKNPHDLARLCADYNIDSFGSETLTKLITVYGERKSVIAKLADICKGVADNALNELSIISDMLSKTPYSDKIVFDFSVINDMNYYNGIVFKGFISGVCEGILAGGQYDKLMQKLERKSGAIGFAVYLDLLEQMPKDKSEYDVDVLLLYSEDCSADVAAAVSKLIEEGKTVSAQKEIPLRLRFKEIVDLRRVDKTC